VEVAELAPGLWRWTAGEVACFYAELEAATLLIDPLVPTADRERFWRHLDADVDRRGRPVAIVATGTSRRDAAGEIAKRYRTDARTGGHPAGVEAFPMGGPDVALWVPEHSALAVGDTVISVGGELRLGPTGRSTEHVRALLELPIEHVLATYGDHVPGGRDALAAALEPPPFGAG
jgi:hypothetical protein